MSSGSNEFEPTYVPAASERRPEPALASPHLLFGMIALQSDFITREQLVAAFDTWVQDKSRDLGQILLSAGAITSDDHELLSRLVAKFLEKHGGDAGLSLAALSSVPQVRPDLERIGDADLTASLGRVASASSDLPGPETVFYNQRSFAGRFRILRPHAKGGLGQVSVAMDQELNREVALKEILVQHSGDASARERFVLEAEITGGLEHPGIVPVYALGQSADGRPFYAMRFVNGDSLKQAIEHFHSSNDPQRRGPGSRQLELRHLLGRFIDVCNAVDYAHSRGVLHRDLKPGNIMVGQYGETLVVDWGLAKAQGKRDVTSDVTSLRASALSSSVQTQPGSAIGTPAYMSPEQAAGKLENLGPATDVYSLGATLYHVLCGRPPYEKENLGVILQKVQKSEFARPRTILPDIPTELQAICLKAMALNPDERYASARLLADDVEHWLADEPITAQRDTVLAATSRYLRKHRAWALSTGAALAVVTVIASIAAVWINSARVRAQTNFRIAQAAVNDLLTDVAEEKLADEAGMTDVRRDLLEKAESYNQRFLEQQNQDPEVRLQSARSRQLVADIHRILGNYDKAEQAYKSAIALLEPLTSAAPNDSRAFQYLAESHTQLGEVCRLTSRMDEADAYYQRSQELTEELIRRFKSPDFRKELAQIYDNRGILYRDTTRPELALKEFEHAIDLLNELMTEFSVDPVYPQRVARSFLNSGPALLKVGRSKEAEEHYDTARKLQQQLIDKYPRKPDYQYDLAANYNNLGRLRLALNQRDAAIESFSESVKLLERLADRFPSIRQCRRELARVKNNLAGILANEGKLTDAEHHFVDARELCRRLMAEDPDVLDYHYGLAETLDNLGWLELRKKPPPTDFVLAQQYLTEGLQEIQLPFERNPINQNYRGVRNDLYKYLAESYLGQSNYVDAAALAQTLSKHENDDDNPHYLAATILARCAVLAQRDEALSADEQQNTAKQCSSAAIEQLREAARFRRPLNRKDLQTTVFDLLRTRDDFKAIESMLPE